MDEISDLALNLQAKLLRAIEDRAFRRVGGEKEVAVDFQLIAASNRNLKDLLLSGEFREDLFHRLNVMSVVVPPLRSRKEELAELVTAFIQEFNTVARKKVQHVPDIVWRRMAAYDWPGNVRELRNAVERCVLLSTSQVFPSTWLDIDPPPEPSAITTAGSRISFAVDGSQSLDEMEASVIQLALKLMDRNVSQAARMLGLSRETLRYRLRKHGNRPEGDVKNDAH